MAKNNKSNKATKTVASTITLDFTNAYEAGKAYLDEPCEGTMVIPTEAKKLNLWGRFKKWLKK